jgi:hypothetical protein
MTPHFCHENVHIAYNNKLLRRSTTLRKNPPYQIPPLNSHGCPGPEEEPRREEVENRQGDDDRHPIEDVEENLSPENVSFPTSQKFNRAVDCPVLKIFSSHQQNSWITHRTKTKTVETATPITIRPMRGGRIPLLLTALPFPDIQAFSELPISLGEDCAEGDSVTIVKGF